ncbi:jg20736 [Pararge aegeria aegeria]|uniref:Jg20736 protein n=1 Tax=Pararge aegeria aegeria TaxID=348720 RepID=A0A8S4RQR7_9NEOP|nr:jg20736 [Pararge aegeria aegeria]
MFIKAVPVASEEERRGSVSNWFSSLRRGGRRKREETAAVPAGYGSLGRRKDGGQSRGKTRSAWDLTTVTRLVCIINNFTIYQ